MFKQKISILINSRFDKYKIFEEFEALIGSLWKTGQIIGKTESPFLSDNGLISFVTTLEKGSLSKKFNDDYVNQRIGNIEKWCDSRLKTELIGKSLPKYKGVCSCKKPDFYILFTHALNDSGCIVCGHCNKIVPLYKLPQLSYNERYDILNWEGNYKSCDNLQLGCTVGEKWATKQLADPNSQLSREGIRIGHRIKELTGIPTYYYLYNYRPISKIKDMSRPCPSCNGLWLLKERLLDFYDFKCDKCRLLSSFSPLWK